MQFFYSLNYKAVLLTNNYRQVIAKRSRFLFLLANFLRNLQFSNVIGFSLEEVYSFFDDSIALAKEALEGKREKIMNFRGSNSINY